MVKPALAIAALVTVWAVIYPPMALLCLIAFGVGYLGSRR